MNKIVVAFLAFVLLFAPHVTFAKGRKRATAHRGRRTTAHHRGPTIRESCPPPITIIKPDSITLSTYTDESNLQAAIASWLATQPEMSEAATNAARNIALYWFRRGREAGQANK